MTENTSTQKAAVFILLIIFVSSFSSVVSSYERTLTGTVHVVLPKLRFRFTPRSIVVMLLPARNPPPFTQEVKIQWSDCESSSAPTKWKKCAYKFDFDAPGIQSYYIGVKLGNKLIIDSVETNKAAWLNNKTQTLIIPRHEPVEKNIKYDMSESEPKVTLY